MKERRVRTIFALFDLASGGSKKCVSVENSSTIVLDAKPDYRVFNFDFVGDEDLEQEVVFN